MRLIIVGELDGFFSKASQIAISNGAKVRKIESVDRVMENIRSGNGAELILIDVKEDIAQLINAMTQERISIPVVACGVSVDKELAVRAIEYGAIDYLPLPPNEKLIAAVIEAVLDREHNLIYNAPAMRKIVDIAKQVAPTDATILITGKSGTGKEVLSRFIHRHSKRKDKPFVSVNCAAIPDNLLESELFGHEKGAFTGAIARRIGKFEESNHGTLLLDEISEIDLRLQAKLLRAIQEREIDRVGGSKPIKLDLRIIATSNRDLMQEVAEGRFREDLFYRLNIINLELPPLCERSEDIEAFAKFFIQKYCNSNGLVQKHLPIDLLEDLKRYSWPGNVRELENTIYRAVLLSPDAEISKDSISSIYQNPLFNMSKIDEQNHQERQMILSAYKYCYGNAAKTANILGLSLNELKAKMQKYEEEHVE